MVHRQKRRIANEIDEQDFFFLLWQARSINTHTDDVVKQVRTETGIRIQEIAPSLCVGREQHV